MALADIIIDPTLQVRDVYPDWVDELAVAQQEGAELPQLLGVRYADGGVRLAAGRHRFEMNKQNDIVEVEIGVIDGTREEAIEIAVFNDSTPAKPRTQVEKRNAIRMLEEVPKWREASARTVAARVGVHHDTVIAVRKEMAGEQRAQPLAESASAGGVDPHKVRAKDGRLMKRRKPPSGTQKPTSKPKPKPKPNASSAPAITAALGPIPPAPSPTATDPEPHHDEQRIRDRPVGFEEVTKEFADGFAEALGVGTTDTLTDTLDLALHGLVQDPEFVRYITGVDTASSVEGIIADDCVLAASRAREYGTQNNIPALANAKTPEIRHSLNAALKRHELECGQATSQPAPQPEESPAPATESAVTSASPQSVESQGHAAIAAEADRELAAQAAADAKRLTWKVNAGAIPLTTIALGSGGRFAIRQYLAGCWLYWESDTDPKAVLLMGNAPSVDEAKAFAQRCYEDGSFEPIATHTGAFSAYRRIRGGGRLTR